MSDYLFWAPDPYLSAMGVTIQVYHLCTLVAVFVGSVLFYRTFRQKGGDRQTGIKSLLLVLVVTVLCTRVVHILCYAMADTLNRPETILQLSAGRSVHGVAMGFGLSALLLNRLGWVQASWCAAPMSVWFSFGLVCARIGNFFNSEGLGTQSNLPWAVRFFYGPDHGTLSRHPVELYEGLVGVLLLVVAALLWRRGAGRSVLGAGVVCVGYGISRFGFDFLRHGPGHQFGDFLTTGQLLSLPLVFFGLWIIKKSK